MLLIVDDEEIITDTLKSLFEKNGYDVMGSYCLNDAKKLVDEGNLPDILLTDIKMPDGTGIDLIEYIKPLKPECHFVVLTGYSDRSEQELKDLGVIKIFQKPFDTKSILKFVNSIPKS